MGAGKGIFSVCSIFLPLWIYWTRITAGYISDACHGFESLNQTYNILECRTGSKICITEVRYYRDDGQDNCPYLLVTDVANECCRRNASRCNWISNVNRVGVFQNMCYSQQKCVLHSNATEILTDNTMCSLESTISSSVRSISYTCIKAEETCPVMPEETAKTNPDTATEPSEDMSRTTVTTLSPQIKVTDDKRSNGSSMISITSEPTHTVDTISDKNASNKNVDGHKNNATGAVVGGVAGSLVVLAGVAVGVFILLKRRSTKAQPPPADYPPNNYDTPPAFTATSGCDTAPTRYSFYQPEKAGEDGWMEDNREDGWMEDNNEDGSLSERNQALNLDDMYSKVDKSNNRWNITSDSAIRNGQGNYDRIQGEAAHFRVHGDYDHLADFSDVMERSDVITRHGIDNPGVDLTYDQLHRGQVVTRPPITETDPYDVLNRAKTSVV